MTNIAIFVSGSGTNCENIIRHFANHSSIRPALVVSNKADAYALVRAERLGVPTAVVSGATLRDAAAMMPILESHNVDFIVLAGFLLMIPEYLSTVFEGRIINIHPALLPKYGGKGMYGHFVHEAVKAAGEAETGITIHHVTPICDGGEIIFQASTPLTPSDTPDDIAAKVHELEQAHFPRVIEEVVTKLG